MDQKIHIFTTPIEKVSKFSRLLERLRMKADLYPGHRAVTGSVVRGLKLLHVPFELNPCVSNIREGDVVLCLYGHDTLQSLLNYFLQKKQKPLLLAGPNIVVGSKDHDCIIGNNLIRKVLVPSDWVRIAYTEDLAVLNDKIAVWPAGVNPSLWSPRSEKPSYYILYNKMGDEKVVAETKRSLIENQILFREVTYGNYSLNEWKHALDNSKGVIFLSESESQGIAMLEAWMMGVPTFVFHRKGDLVIANRKYSTFSPSPYLKSGLNGFFWSSKEQLIFHLKQFNIDRDVIRRDAIESHSDEASCNALLKIISRIE